MSPAVVVLVSSACLLGAGCTFDTGGLGGAPGDAGPGDAVPPADAPPDRDTDGVPDQDDNCPDFQNAAQGDEDADDVGDVCDNCPVDANPAQEDQGEINAGVEADGVGDACDPRRDGAGDRIAFFDGFNGGGRDPAWTVARGGETWVQEGGLLKQTETGAPAKILYWDGGTLSRAVIDTVITYDSVPPPGGSRYRLAGVVAHFQEGSGTGTGYSCTQIRDDEEGFYRLHLLRFDNESIFYVNGGADLPGDIEVGPPYRYRFAVDGPDRELRCGISSPSLIDPPVTNNDFEFIGEDSSGFLGLRTFQVTASFHYAVIYELGGAL